MEKPIAQQLWYKNAVFYAVIVEVFKDGNGDGVGDFIGLTQSLDYIADLGVSCIWLLPFYPTSGRDNGYDVSDYCAIDPRLGTFLEFETFIKEANKRGLKVIVDLVVHHTSTEHTWFQQSIRSEGKYKDYYIWTKDIPKEKQVPSAFPGIEAGVWEHNPERKEFYYHSFYHFEPDLNVANPEVQREIEQVMHFWMKKGIDGFRMDAATLMFAKKGLEGTEVVTSTEMMEGWNTLVKAYKKDAIILGEADVTIDEIPQFFGQGGRMDLLYNFLLNRYIFLSLAKKDATDMKEFLKKLPVPPFKAQWVNFLRNHDELNIEQLKKKIKTLSLKRLLPRKGWLSMIEEFGVGLLLCLRMIFVG